MKKHLSTWAILSAAFALCSLSSCSNEESNAPGSSKVAIQMVGDAPEAAYTHAVAIYKKAAGEAASAFVEKKEGADAFFTITPEEGALYHLRAYAISNANVNFGTFLEDDGVGIIELTDVNNVPDILTGESAEAAVEKTGNVAVDMKRIVSKVVFNIPVNDKVAIQAITATISTYGKIAPAGKVGVAPKVDKVINLTAGADAFTAEAFVSPSAYNDEDFVVKYKVTSQDGTVTEKTSTYAQKLVANNTAEITVNLSVNGEPINGGTAMGAAPAENVSYISDSIEL